MERGVKGADETTMWSIEQIICWKVIGIRWQVGVRSVASLNPHCNMSVWWLGTNNRGGAWCSWERKTDRMKDRLTDRQTNRSVQHTNSRSLESDKRRLKRWFFFFSNVAIFEWMECMLTTTKEATHKDRWRQRYRQIDMVLPPENQNRKLTFWICNSCTKIKKPN